MYKRSLSLVLLSLVLSLLAVACASRGVETEPAPMLGFAAAATGNTSDPLFAAPATGIRIIDVLIGVADPTVPTSMPGSVEFQVGGRPVLDVAIGAGNGNRAWTFAPIDLRLARTEALVFVPSVRSVVGEPMTIAVTARAVPVIE